MATTRSTRRRAAAPVPTRSFDDFEPKTRQAPGGLCARCKKNKRGGAVGVRLNKLENGSYKQITSRQLSMCEQCAISVYETLVGGLEQEMGL